MEDLIQDTVNYNSAYISLSLLDELDYCLGGYGKPTPEFIFSLNTFVESFIGCSEFYTSLDELNHLSLTAPAIFPTGRPILNMLVRETGLKFVSGVLETPGRVIYRVNRDGKSKKEAEQEFITEYGRKLKTDYFIQSDVSNPPTNLPLVTGAFNDEDEFIVTEVQTSSHDLISNLISVSNTSTIQTTLPIGLYGQQVNEIARTPYSIEALEKLSKLHQVQLEDLLESLGYHYLPIPPFTTILLAQLDNIDQIPAKLAQLRADFQELREHFILLERQIQESPSIREQLDARKAFNSFWTTFVKKYVDHSHRLLHNHLDVFQNADLDKSANTFLKSHDLKDGLKEINFAKIAGKILTHSMDWFKDRKVINRFKGLTNIWELFQNSTNINQQLKHFERLFGVSFSNAELNRIHEFINNKVTNIPKKIST
ncbi:MAG: hypothetical protein V4687_13730 [Bacteroidota bacterium]